MIWRKSPPFSPSSNAIAAVLIAAVLGSTGLRAQEVAEPPKVIDPAPANGPTVEALEEMLAGEFALQKGRFADAAAHYDKASAATRDPAIAERATRIALMAGDAVLAERGLRRWESLAPPSASSMAVGVQIHMARNDASAAARSARALLAQTGGWRALLGLLGQPTIDGGAAARAVLQRVINHEDWPEGVEANLAFAGLARRFGDAKVAGRLLDRLARDTPDDPRVLVAQAPLDREAGRNEAASAHLRRAQTLRLTPEVRRSIAGELDALGDPAGAAELIAVGPQDDTTYMLRAAWLVDADNKAALAALDAEIQKAGLNPARQLLLGQIAEVRSAWADAERWYRSVTTAPERDRARLRLAVAIEKGGRPDEAIAWLRSLQQANDLHGEPLRDAYLHEAEAWARRPDDKAAMDAYARGLATFADDAVLLYARAMHHVRSERVDEGLADLRRIIDRDGNHAEALNAYGYTLAEYRQRYAEALPYVEKSNRLQPGSAATLDSLGWIRLKMGKRHAALALLRDAWSRGEDPEIAAHLGEVLWLTGDRDEARRIWARGRELDPDNKALRATVEKFKP